VEVLLDELRLHARLKELIYMSEMCSKAVFCLYLISLFNEIVVSRLRGVVPFTL
jgi:hypothetical protein